MKKILAIDTSCDETSAAVTEGLRILSNIVWSQASLHAQWGGVMPSLAQREHEARIDWVIERALKSAHVSRSDICAIAVTAGPGLAIALGVGISKAKELSTQWKIPLIAINHIEGHLLSALAEPRSGSKKIIDPITFPAVGLIISGGHTELVSMEKTGTYSRLATTQDDALGEALDKAARMLGLGYPGGALLEKLARKGNSRTYALPLPMAGRENLSAFSYSGLKSAMYRLVEHNKPLDATKIADLAASFQDMAFKHLLRISQRTLKGSLYHDLLVGGGVAANVEVRSRLRELGKEHGLQVRFPYSPRLYGDNAGMIGVAASFKLEKEIFSDPELVDRVARSCVDRKFAWEASTGV